MKHICVVNVMETRKDTQMPDKTQTTPLEIETDPEMWAAYMLEKCLIDVDVYEDRNEEGDQLIHVIKTIQQGAVERFQRELLHVTR